MRPLAAVALTLTVAILQGPLRGNDKGDEKSGDKGNDKLTFDEKVELVRGLTAEYATAKQFLPRSKKALEFESTGAYDKKRWEAIAREMGPAARTGDQVKITRVTLETDKILLEINGGLKSGRHWYDHVQTGMGPISNGEMHPTTGTNIEILFHKPLATLTSADVKKILAPLFDFEKRSATQLYAQSLPPEVQKAIADKRVLEGMDRDQVLLAMGHPVHKSRETKDGVELEDWVYGTPPGRITFVTFTGDKVIKVKEEYAGLGNEAAGPEPTPQ
jgi:hypothetical protein